MRKTRFLNGAGLAVGGLMMAASGGFAANGDTRGATPLPTPPPAESPMAPADRIEPPIRGPNARPGTPATTDPKDRDEGQMGTPQDGQSGTPPPTEEAETPRPTPPMPPKP
ncbi:MAG: hypothetical protein IH626_18175 [Rhodospirillales bacterium]|nr:hypothetical protein [Rhodospirillales bacterium]